MAVATTTDIAEKPAHPDGSRPEPWLLRLMHLVSPVLPTGGFAYSQGLEWAVENGWITDAETLVRWLDNLLGTTMARVDIPLLGLMYRAVSRDDPEAFDRGAAAVLAFRETRELRLEERNRGRALAAILQALGFRKLKEPASSNRWHPVISTSQLAGFAFAAAGWSIPLQNAAAGYLWSWLENQVICAVKIIPLGQTQGQQVLIRLSGLIDSVVATGLSIRQVEEMGAALPGFAIASCRHETMYTRLFRS